MRAKEAAMDSPPVNKTHLFVYAVGFRTLPDGDKGVLDPCANEHVVPQAMWDAAFGEIVQAIPFNLLFQFEKAKLIPPSPKGVQAVGFRTLPDGDKEVLDPCAKEHVVPPAMWDAAFGQTIWKCSAEAAAVAAASSV